MFTSIEELQDEIDYVRENMQRQDNPINDLIDNIKIILFKIKIIFITRHIIKNYIFQRRSL